MLRALWTVTYRFTLLHINEDIILLESSLCKFLILSQLFNVAEQFLHLVGVNTLHAKRPHDLCRM